MKCASDSFFPVEPRKKPERYIYRPSRESGSNRLISPLTGLSAVILAEGGAFDGFFKFLPEALPVCIELGGLSEQAVFAGVGRFLDLADFQPFPDVHGGVQPDHEHEDDGDGKPKPRGSHPPRGVEEDFCEDGEDNPNSVDDVGIDFHIRDR